MVKNGQKSIFSIKGPIFSIKGPVTIIFLGEPEKPTLDKIFGHFGPLLGFLGLAKFQKIVFFFTKNRFFR